jgi:hypothetical protein
MADNGFSRSDWLRLISTITWLVIFMLWPRFTFAVTLLAVGDTMIAYNAMIFWLTVVRKDHAPSVAPIVGGVIAAAGVALLPLAGSWQWAWVPLMIDWGGLPHFLAALFKELPR